MYKRFIAILEHYIFPAVISYAKHPITILLELLLIPMLIGFRDAVVFVLVMNSYLNAFANAEGSIILHSQDAHHEENKATLEQMKASHDILRQEVQQTCLATHTHQDIEQLQQEVTRLTALVETQNAMISAFIQKHQDSSFSSIIPAIVRSFTKKEKQHVKH